MTRLTIVVVLVLTVSTGVAAQTRPPLPNEPVATEGTTKQFYRGLNVAIVKTLDGVGHVYSFTRGLFGGGNDAGGDALGGLREGAHVAIHYSSTDANALAEAIDVPGDEVLNITEAVVTNIDRGKREIAIRFVDGDTATLRMISRLTTDDLRILGDSGKAPGTLVVYFEDESGRRVGHYFAVRQ
jgi:hypothetical protein